MLNIVPAKVSKRLHLDFHNHPTVKGIGANLTPANFAAQLANLGIDSVALFAKCHHGMSYYPTKIGTPHFGMAGDLLSDQVKACESAGVDYHLYMSVLRDNYAFDNHPEWRWIGADGQPVSQDAEYRTVCINTGYYWDYLKPQVEEALRLYPDCAGMWLDIIRYRGDACYCPNCTRDASQLALSAQDFNKKMLLERYSELQQICKAKGKELTLNTIIFLGNQDWRSLTPLEIESILAHVGSFFFPMFSRYMNRYPSERYGITHSFYENWREFGAMKHPVQMQYEACQMVFSGYGVSLGDELEPDGTFDQRRFPVLQSGYRLADRLSKICDLSLPPVPEIGLICTGPEAAQEDGQTRGSQDEFVRGAFKALIETHRQVAVLDSEEDYSPYRALVLHASTLESSDVRTRLETYLAHGGKALILGHAGSHGLRWLGVELISSGNANYQFLELEPWKRQLIRSRGEVYHITGDLKPLFKSYLPYGDAELGNRELTYLRPVDPSTGFESIYAHKDGQLIYCSPDFASDYQIRGNWATGQLMSKMLELLNAKPLVTGTIPAATEVWLCADRQSMELRALDCTLKRETVSYAQMTEYDVTRSYSFEVEQIVPITKVIDQVSGKVLPHTLRDGRVIVEIETSEPYVVLRLYSHTSKRNPPSF